MNLETEKPYIFVRLVGGKIRHTELTRNKDGSGGFQIGSLYHIYEHTPDTWEEACSKLQEHGFERIDKAKAIGMIHEDWAPTEESKEGSEKKEFEFEQSDEE